MAYAERRGTGKRAYYRGRYKTREKDANGRYKFGQLEQKYTTKTAAENAAAAEEARIWDDTHVYVDPRKARVTFGEWSKQWMRVQKKAGTTTAKRWALLKNPIWPRWEHVPIGDINWFEVKAWADGIDDRDYVGVGHAVTLMSMILTGAVDAGLLAVNPLFRRRRNTSTQKQAKKAEKPRIWCREDVALAIADRLPPAYRLMLIMAAFTGMRYGELCALHRDNAVVERTDTIGGRPVVRHVVHVHALHGELQEYKETLEDGTTAVRRHLGPPKPPNGSRDIDLPPFLVKLLREHMDTWPHPYLFSSPQGEFWWRRNFNRRIMAPAADGRPARAKSQGHPAQEGWEPILPGLRLHGARHGHSTRMEEGDRLGQIPQVLRCERLGHEYRGIPGVYNHVTPEMRQRLMRFLEEVWNQVNGITPESVPRPTGRTRADRARRRKGLATAGRSGAGAVPGARPGEGAGSTPRKALVKINSQRTPRGAGRPPGPASQALDARP